MALDKFRASPLPNPPAQYDSQYMRQVIRVLETYFSQLDSRTPNNAQKYTADEFVGGSFSGTDVTATNVATTNLSASQAVVGNLDANVVKSVYTDTEALHSFTSLTSTIMGDHFYGGYFYGDGRYLQTPYNQLTSNSSQTAPDIATANALTLTTNEFPDGISIASSSHIVFAQPGIYNITYSLQFKNTLNNSESIDVWLRLDGTDLANSNTRFAIPPRKSAGDPSYLVAVTPIMVDIETANQYVQIMWRVSDVAVTLEALPAVTASPGVTPAIPATPSAIIGVTFISAQFPDVTRVAPLPVFGFGEIGDIEVITR